ncbi:hypothetical protein PFICI_10853 [Pestalotiopsis fici W106-1]|uniref:Lariat debranching enzyme C-terminal domain-containing protein n=1 Tax=Pestalotiopsis fici (strain W106-1 / CGMCC3.15140) TaxID=1229662 RepID=W3WT32_PESFW|nr:uncharacterized protein PFICI_10853 [Pestalotiopsis fici W106-1]ETS76979.1 hypothetical protein PFICI_10853 [Pestalotiopsis fici W106-1]
MEELHQSSLLESGGVRVAVQGCGHGHLDSIYQSVQNAAESRGWDGVDLVIIGGDFQAVRNAADLTVMSVPIKYRKLGDFPEYYSGRTKAPFLTIFIGGNHEASSHSWELYYGGWVAPNIYYLGSANVLRFGPIRIAGMSGIWNDPDYNKPHIERLPFNHSNHSNHNDIKSFYHVREFDVRKLLLIREQVDIGLSHDWPKGIERYGDEEALWRIKPFFKRGSLDGTLGSPAATYVLDRLRPLYWFSAHMHCTFSAVKRFEVMAPASPSSEQKPRPVSTEPSSVAPSAVSPGIPGQSVPATIFNTETKFLALDKCGPGKKHLELCYIKPATAASKSASKKFILEYDPEWLAITRVFHQYLTIGERDAKMPANEGENVYTEMIDKERRWVNEHIVAQDKLTVPENFTLTAPPHNPGDPETVNSQPREYTNPQTVAFCELLQIKNLWDATSQERNHRKAQGPHRDPQPRSGNRGGRGRGKDGDRGGGHGGGGRDCSIDRP